MRGILALMAMFFAFQLGGGVGRRRRIAGWAMRTLLTLLGVWWRNRYDGVFFGTVALVLLLAGFGYYLAIRPKYKEDIVEKMFEP